MAYEISITLSFACPWAMQYLMMKKATWHWGYETSWGLHLSWQHDNPQVVLALRWHLSASWASLHYSLALLSKEKWVGICAALCAHNNFSVAATYQAARFLMILISHTELEEKKNFSGHNDSRLLPCKCSLSYYMHFSFPKFWNTLRYGMLLLCAQLHHDANAR